MNIGVEEIMLNELENGFQALREGGIVPGVKGRRHSSGTVFFRYTWPGKSLK
eukprot:UN00513